MSEQELDTLKQLTNIYVEALLWDSIYNIWKVNGGVRIVDKIIEIIDFEIFNYIDIKNELIRRGYFEK